MKPTIACTTLFAALALSAAPAQAQWSQSTLSQARAELASITVGDLSFFAGGNKGNSPSKRVDIYNALTDSWDFGPHTALSVARRSIGVTSVGNYVLFAGGGYFGTGPTAVVDVYDMTTGLWSLGNPLSQARATIGATTVGTKAMFAGGIAAGNSVSGVVDIYDSTLGPPSFEGAWSTHTLATPRAFIAAETAGTKALFAGGGTPITTFSVVDIYDDASDTWSQANLSQARSVGDIASISIGSLAIFPGGQIAAPDPMTTVVDIYDAQSNTWSAGNLSVPRSGSAVAGLGNHVLFAGGALTGAPTSTVSNVVDRYNVGTGRWDVVAPLSQARVFLAGASGGGKIHFGGGATSLTTMSNVLDTYEPVGVSYCGATQNSTGAAASIDASGSKSLAANSLVLRADDVPNTPFLFFHGGSQAQLPFGDGYLCAAGGIVRIGAAAAATGGVAQKTVNLAAAGITTPGARHFQCWFRDVAAGGAGFNTSDAIGIGIEP